jgi:hypothetical protein
MSMVIQSFALMPHLTGCAGDLRQVRLFLKSIDTRLKLSR